MQLRRFAFVVPVLALALAGCKGTAGSKGSAPSAGAAATPSTPPAPSTAAEGSAALAVAAPRAPADGREVIRTGQVELLVTSYDTARAKIDALVKQAGGYIDATSVEHRRGDAGAATLVVRVPCAAFGAFVPQLGTVGDLVSETTHAEDITDQYVDLSARLASAQVLEQRLLQLASAKTATVDQVLAVERELERVRGEIEGYQGHLREWNDQVAMSTLTVVLATSRPELAAAEVSLGERTSGAFHGSVAALRAFGAALLVGLIALAPWLLVLIPAWLLVRRLRPVVKRLLGRAR